MTQDKPLHTLTDANFQAEVLASSQPALVVFGALWSGTCHMLAPCLHALAAEFAGRAVVGRIDAEANPETVGRYGVQSIPTMLFFYRGTVVDHVIGAVPRASLRDRLNRLLHA